MNLSNLGVAAIFAVGIGATSFYAGHERGYAKADRAAAERVAVAEVQAAKWKEKADAAQQRYDEQGKAMGRLAADNATLVGRLQKQPADTRRASCETVREAYQGAERDLGGCAADVDRFGREAAEAARSHRALDAAWPTRGDDRKATRARREATRKE